MAVKAARRADIVSTLRSRGLDARAAWFQRQLPEIVDVPSNRSLLSTLDIDPGVLAEAMAPGANASVIDGEVGSGT
jgi:hypothetical protein